MRHNFIWKIEARLTRVAPGDTADTVGAKGEAAEGLRRLSGLSVAGPSENIRRTVTVVESYRKRETVFCIAPSLHTALAQGFLFCPSRKSQRCPSTPRRNSKKRGKTK